MKKHLIILGIAVLLICVVLSGCLSSEESKFIGSWRDNLGDVVQFKDGIFYKPAEITSWGITVEGSWKIEGDVLYVEYTVDGQKIMSKYTYEFQDGGNSVKMTIYGSSVAQTWTKI